MNYKTIKVDIQEKVARIEINRPDADNTINDDLINEFMDVLDICEKKNTIVIIEGSKEVFCNGGDFNQVHEMINRKDKMKNDPEPLYKLWLRLAEGPFIIISHIRGKTNAGGVGFLCASDIVLSDKSSQISLSELLFGLFPACVMPFLIRRIGFQKAHYMTMMTKPINYSKALEWGLIDAVSENSFQLVQNHLHRLKCLNKKTIKKYKQYMNKLYINLIVNKTDALEANRMIFSDEENLNKIFRFVEYNEYPWET